MKEQENGNKRHDQRINALEELAELLGPGDVTFHFQDDTAKVPIGLTVVLKEAPF